MAILSLLAGLVLIAAVIGLVVRLRQEREGGARCAERLRALERQLEDFRNKPEIWEYRIEQFSLLWYPTLTVSPAAREITAAVAGMPHCAKCIRPLAASQEGWSCPQCGDKRPESVADVVVIDSVTRQALQYFQERHPGYRVALKK